jgi:aconitate hydratase
VAETRGQHRTALGLVGRRHDHEVGIVPRVECRLELGQHLLVADHRLSRRVAAALWKHLVLDEEPGNSGPLIPEVSQAVNDHDLAVVSVLSGNRNFEGRIHPQVRMSFLASPPLCVAYALAGTTDLDLPEEPLGLDRDASPVYLRDIWPSTEEVARVVAGSMDPDAFRERYGRIFEGDDRWRSLPVPEGDLYEWDPASTYLTEPPFVADIGTEPAPVRDITVARVLVSVGETVTTDHISPAGAIKADSPAGRYLLAHGVQQRDFNSYGSRRGNHEVMIRGTFANIRLRNELAPGTEGGWTATSPGAKPVTIYDAAMEYQRAGVALLVVEVTRHDAA